MLMKIITYNIVNTPNYVTYDVCLYSNQNNNSLSNRIKRGSLYNQFNDALCTH